MEAVVWVEGIRVDGGALVAALGDAGDLRSVRVPSCPDWTLADLAAHVGTFVGQFLGRAPSGDNGPGAWAEVPEPAADRVPWLAGLFADLDARFAVLLADAGDDHELPFPVPRLPHARRICHEVAVHRWDADRALSRRPPPLDEARAIDGIDEFLTVFAPMGPHPNWAFDIADDASASASERLLRLWGRRPGR